jgi:hypothetical protein
MFSHISRWSALSALLFLGATVLPSSLQGQQSAAADRSTTAAQALTVVANPLLVNTAAQATTAETSIMVPRAGPAPVIAPYLALSDPLLVPFGITIPVPASPLALSMAPKQDDGVHVGANLALVGVGAAALVTGLVMDNDAGTIIAVGGGVVALIGFYRWLK